MPNSVGEGEGQGPEGHDPGIAALPKSRCRLRKDGQGEEQSRERKHIGDWKCCIHLNHKLSAKQANQVRRRRRSDLKLKRQTVCRVASEVFCDTMLHRRRFRPMLPMHSVLLFSAVGVLSSGAFAVDLSNVSYANNSTDLETGARLAGDAGVSLGLPGDPSHLSRSPAGLADVDRPEVVVHHGSLYQDLSLSQDEVYLAAPLSVGTLGLGISRIGADGILRSDRGETPDFNNPSTFSATDWIGTLAFARTWVDGRLRGGASLRLLGRSIDQTSGAGAEMDASLVWAQAGWRAGLRMDRGLGGFALWRTGTAEYSPPNLEAGLGWEHPFPYFYGTLALAWETPGLLQPEATSSFSEGDARPWKDPYLFARASRLAAEFH